MAARFGSVRCGSAGFSSAGERAPQTTYLLQGDANAEADDDDGDDDHDDHAAGDDGNENNDDDEHDDDDERDGDSNSTPQNTLGLVPRACQYTVPYSII